MTLRMRTPPYERLGSVCGKHALYVIIKYPFSFRIFPVSVNFYQYPIVIVLLFRNKEEKTILGLYCNITRVATFFVAINLTKLKLELFLN
jgi:hypothetical protein